MHRIIVALALLTSVALMAGCSSGPAAVAGNDASQTLALTSPPWSDGEKTTYDLLDERGAKVGIVEFALVQDGGVWVISESDRTGDLDLVQKVRVDAKTLKPLGEEKKAKTSKADAQLSTTYKDGKLDIRFVVNGEQKSAVIDVPSNALDNDQLLMTLRALRFVEGYEGKYVNVVAGNGTKVDSVVRVKGRGTVEVPAGRFEAWHLELQFGLANQNVWYQVDAPHYMVKYDSGRDKWVLAEPRR